MLIPALDLIDGQIVRLKQGDFNEKTVFNVDPLSQIKSYKEAGAALVHLVDLDGAKDPSKRQLELIKKLVRDSGVDIQTGGGIRSYTDIVELLEIGVKRVVVGSKAVQDLDFGRQILHDFGSERICLALDVRMQGSIAYVATHGWLETSSLTVQALLNCYIPYGLKHVLVTDIAKDGMMQGPNLKLYHNLTNLHPELNIIASGGISSLEDLQMLRAYDVPSAVLGKSLLSGAFSLQEALKLWPNDTSNFSFTKV